MKEPKPFKRVPWPVAAAAFGIGFLLMFGLVNMKSQGEVSYNIGYQAGYSDGVEEGAGYEPNPGIQAVLLPVGGVLAAVGVVGLVITAIRFKLNKGAP